MANLMTKGRDGMTLEGFLQNVPKPLKNHFTCPPNSIPASPIALVMGGLHGAFATLWELIGLLN